MVMNQFTREHLLQDHRVFSYYCHFSCDMVWQMKHWQTCWAYSIYISQASFQLPSTSFTRHLIQVNQRYDVYNILIFWHIYVQKKGSIIWQPYSISRAVTVMPIEANKKCWAIHLMNTSKIKYEYLKYEYQKLNMNTLDEYLKKFLEILLTSCLLAHHMKGHRQLVAHWLTLL
jgi:hypothetical protein